MAAKVVCISVVDEADTSTHLNNRNSDFNNFRNTYPNREIWLLNPQPSYTSQLGIPNNWNSDPLAFGPITVSRLDSRYGTSTVPPTSDWFEITGLDDAESGTVVSLAVDTSGSTRLPDVQDSYDQFIADCNAAGFVLVVNTTFSNERWIPPHNVSVPPNTSISVSPSTILRNGSGATLSWTSAGDITDIAVTGVTNPGLSGSVTVNPQNTTTYDITAEGPAGDSGDSVTLTVVGPPNISSFTASPNPQTSGTDGIPNYNTTLSWSASSDLTVTSATISSGTYSASVPNPSASGSFQVTNLPQSVAGSGGASRTYTLTLCHSLACSTETVTVEVTNDNTPSNTWTTEFTGLEPNTSYSKNLGTLAGIDMITKVSCPTSGVFFANGANGSYANPQYFSNGQNVYMKMTTLPFNSDLSNLPADQTFGKPNPKTVSVTIGNLMSFNVTFTTRPPNIGETFNFDGASGEYPYEDIDLITNTPSEYAVTQTLNMDDIDVDVEIRTDDPSVEIKINNEPWQNIQEI
jgi:hypothetical protein